MPRYTKVALDKMVNQISDWEIAAQEVLDKEEEKNNPNVDRVDEYQERVDAFREAVEALERVD